MKKIESDFITAKVRTACTMSCTLEHQPPVPFPQQTSSFPKWEMPLGTCKDVSRLSFSGGMAHKS